MLIDVFLSVLVLLHEGLDVFLSVLVLSARGPRRIFVCARFAARGSFGTNIQTLCILLTLNDFIFKNPRDDLSFSIKV